MDTILNIVRQEEIEAKYSRKNIDKMVREVVTTNPLVMAKVDMGVEIITEWLEQPDVYTSKRARMDQLKTHVDLKEMVTDIFVAIAYFPVETLFTSVCAQVAGHLGFSDRREAILTVSELLALLCDTDAFDITKEERQASLMLVSRIPLSKELQEYVAFAAYLPPMVCTPNELKTNYCSGYLTHKDSLILGTGNHHNGDICLDALNIMNSVALQLDTQLLSTLEEEPKKPLETAEQRDLWVGFKAKSYEMYMLMAKLGNRFHLTHKVDKRGRAYAQGYHISTQGSPFKKAAIELANEQVVQGVPT